jgi:hypothetical protein
MRKGPRARTCCHRGLSSALSQALRGLMLQAIAKAPEEFIGISATRTPWRPRSLCWDRHADTEAAAPYSALLLTVHGAE